MATLRELNLAQAESNNKVGTIESILAGVGSGPEPTPASIDSIVPTLLLLSA